MGRSWTQREISWLSIKQLYQQVLCLLQKIMGKNWIRQINNQTEQQALFTNTHANQNVCLSSTLSSLWLCYSNIIGGPILSKHYYSFQHYLKLTKLSSRFQVLSSKPSDLYNSSVLIKLNVDIWVFYLSSYRATHDIRRLTEDAKREKQRQENRQRKRIPPSTVFGVPTRWDFTDIINMWQIVIVMSHDISDTFRLSVTGF